jgi:hypothetical protein
VLGVDRDDGHGVLASLTLVDGHGVGEHQFVQLVKVVEDLSFIDLDSQFLLDVVDPNNATDVAVEDTGTLAKLIWVESYGTRPGSPSIRTSARPDAQTPALGPFSTTFPVAGSPPGPKP